MEIELRVPKDLSEITLGQYQEFINIQSKSDDDEFVAQKMISIFCGISMLEVLKIRLTSLNDLIEHFGNIFSVKHDFVERFILNGVEYGHIPKLEDMSFGEYIDLETNMADVQNYHIAMSTFYRPITNKVRNMHDIEEYQPSDEKQRRMLKMPLNVVLGASVFFLQFRNRVTKMYPQLFKSTDSEDENKDFSSRGQFAKQWGWYNSIYAIANGDLTKFDTVTKLNILQCLTYLTFEKQKNEIEQQELKKIRK